MSISIGNISDGSNLNINVDGTRLTVNGKTVYIGSKTPSPYDEFVKLQKTFSDPLDDDITKDIGMLTMGKALRTLKDSTKFVTDEEVSHYENAVEHLKARLGLNLVSKIVSLTILKRIFGGELKPNIVVLSYKEITVDVSKRSTEVKDFEHAIKLIDTPETLRFGNGYEIKVSNYTSPDIVVESHDGKGTNTYQYFTFYLLGNSYYIFLPYMKSDNSLCITLHRIPLLVGL